MDSIEQEFSKLSLEQRQKLQRMAAVASKQGTIPQKLLTNPGGAGNGKLMRKARRKAEADQEKRQKVQAREEKRKNEEQEERKKKLGTLKLKSGDGEVKEISPLIEQQVNETSTTREKKKEEDSSGDSDYETYMGHLKEKQHLEDGCCVVESDSDDDKEAVLKRFRELNKNKRSEVKIQEEEDFLIKNLVTDVVGDGKDNKGLGLAEKLEERERNETRTHSADAYREKLKKKLEVKKFGVSESKKIEEAVKQDSHK
jgi:hypothetical protein